jgi:predicted deacylase
MNRQLLAVSVAAIVTAAPVIAQQPDRPTFTVGSAVATRGTLAKGVLAVPAGSDSALDIQVAVIHGAKPGPVVAFIAGTHATEFATVIAMQKLIPRIDPLKLAGTVIIVPAVNIPSFTSMTPIRNPIDNKTMVGGYPGDSAGTQSQRAMWLLVQQVIAQSDVVVDFHGGDLDEDVGAPFTAAVRGGRARPDSESLRLARAFRYNHILIQNRDAASPRVGSTLAGQAMIRGETVLLAAIGRSGVVAPADLSNVVNGCLNMLGALKMIVRPLPTTPFHPLYLDGNGPRIAATSSGVWFPVAKANSMVKQGDVLGVTTDFLGTETGKLLSPIDGLLVYIHGVPSMRRGVVLAEVLPVLPSVPEWVQPAGRGGRGGQ